MRYRRSSAHPGWLHEPGDFGLPWSAHLPLPFAKAQWRPPADVLETDDALTLKLELAGLDERDFRVSLEAGILVIEGERRWEPPCAEACCHAVEVRYGPFRFEVPVGQRFGPDRIQTSYERGFLTVRLAKSAEASE